MEWTRLRDEEWRRDLRGLSLIAELDVDDDDLDRAVEYFGAFLRMNSVSLVRKRYPAFFAVTLANLGMREWQAGTFYEFVAEALGVPESKVNDATREFRAALLNLGLPDFEEAEGMRWVTPVLLHGAIPLDHLDELLDLIRARRTRNPTLDGETFVDWVRLSPGAQVGQPKALTRFLSYGGDFASDYVTRVLDLLDGEPARLPRRVEQRLSSLIVEGRGVTTGRRYARATINYSPYHGLQVRLPAIAPADGRSARWVVNLDGFTHEVISRVPFQLGRTTTEPETVPVVHPVRTVSVAVEETSNAFPFVRREDPLLVFDERGDFVQSVTALSAGRVTLMWPSVSGAPTRGEGEPVEGVAQEVPYGWEGWRAIETTVMAGQSIRLSNGPKRRVRADNRARLAEGDFVPGLRTPEGLPISAENPLLLLPDETDPGQWEVTVADSDGRAMSRFTPSSVRIDPLAELATPIAGTFTVQARGPLGRGISRRVAVVAGLCASYEPSHRRLTGRGLVPGEARFTLGRSEWVVRLGPDEPQVTTEIDSRVRVVVEPPHTAVATASDGQHPEWRIRPTSLMPDELPDTQLLVRGLPNDDEVWLVLETPDGIQQLRTQASLARTARFDLTKVANTARTGRTGTLWLVAGQRIAVAHVRPPRLAEGLSLRQNQLVVESEITTGLEVAVHRRGAPWEPGTLIPVINGLAPLPVNLTIAGPLRVQVRVKNPWVAEPADTFPRLTTDVFDLFDIPWDASAEPPGLRPLVAYMLGDFDAEVPPDAIPVVLSMMRDGSGSAVVPWQRLVDPLRRNPQDTMREISASRLSSPEITFALVASGLTYMDAALVVQHVDVESLAPRSGIAAVVARSSDLADGGSFDREDVERRILEGVLGDEFGALLGGDGFDNARLGRFGEELVQNPHLVDGWYSMLAPVPTLLLDQDARIAAAYELWRARTHLVPQSKVAAGIINRARRVVQSEAPTLVALIDARLSQDGVLALPPLSIAAALTARLAAHGSPAAGVLAHSIASHHAALAQWAPQLTAIDLVRADAAVIGANR